MNDNLLVNAVYPLKYFTLPGVDSIQYPDQYFWASKQRFAAEDDSTNYLSVRNGGNPTSEYLELDLGRVREVNYLSMDMLRVPVDITIEYDVISGIDGVHSWVLVQRLESMDYTDRLTYDPNSRNAWFSGDYYFTDPKRDIINTRFLRIRFERRDEGWPVKGTAPFRWPVIVKNLRSGRYIGTEIDTVGRLLGIEDVWGGNDPTAIAYGLPDDSATITREVRQRFRLPVDASRGSVVPDILGFGVLIQTDLQRALAVESGQVFYGDHEWHWSLYQVGNISTKDFNQVLLQTGTTTGVVSEGKTWLDFYLLDGLNVPTDPNVIYELRIRSLNPNRSRIVWLKQEHVSVKLLSGTITFTHNNVTLITSVDLRNEIFPGDLIQKSDEPIQTYTVLGITGGTITLKTPYTGVTASGAAVVVDPLALWGST